MSDAIIIAGYYRSGTSALAGALQRLGVTLHNDADPNEHNPLGFYEIPELIEFDVDLFNRLGIDWTDIRGLPEGWHERADIARYLSRLEEILRRRFNAEPLWGIKHPHLCRLFPLYERAVTQAGHKPHVIHICRNPFVVAASQQRKNQLSRAHVLLLWVSYLVTAERHARHLPRSWLTYEDLLAQPAAQLKRIEQDLGIELNRRGPNGLREAAAHLTGQLNRAAPLAEAELFGPLTALTKSVWECVRTRNVAPADWDRFAAACAEITGFITEIGGSRGIVMAGFGMRPAMAANDTAPAGLRPAERVDEGARRRLLARRDAAGRLPRVTVFIAAPPSRAHAVNDTLESLRGQWHAPHEIVIITVDPVDIAGHATLIAPAEAGALTRSLCGALNQATTDYVAVINAGDTLAPDACIRFALEAAATDAAMIYCDEVVPSDNGAQGQGAWIRYKPGWDITRLRQSAYIGDWVWYRAAALQDIGGFDAALAGAEEYDAQLRLGEAGALVHRLPEALFSRASLSRRDNIPATIFGPRAAAAIAAHLRRVGIPAEIQPRRNLGLFEHRRAEPDPGTAILLLCDHAEVADLDHWVQELLTNGAMTGLVILAGAELPEATARYLVQVAAQAETLGRVVQAVPPAPNLTPAAALAAGLRLAGSPLVAVIYACARPATADWLGALRNRLADPGVALAAARMLVPLGGQPNRHTVQGPLIAGADTRLGAGHLADDPGPGGWLAVDQEASAVAPVFLVRRQSLLACITPNLTGDALWIDLGAQLRSTGARLVWTPDVSFTIAGRFIAADYECRHRGGTPAARIMPGQDPYHHPALSLRGDLLAPELRHGLVPGAPADKTDLLLTGPAETSLAVLNTARALRAAGLAEASWVGEHLLPAELARRAPTRWVRLNPQAVLPGFAMPYEAVFTRAPGPAAKDALHQAAHIYATSPALALHLRKSLPPGRPVTLWRPLLSRAIWASTAPGTGLNTAMRVLWIDEGGAPDWLPELMQLTQPAMTWIVVGTPLETLPGTVAKLPPPADEHGWARELCALAPHVLVRPAGRDAGMDHYTTLMAAAAGCALLVDDRLDLPEALGATRLPNRLAAWQRALQSALAALPATLERGAQTRAAALTLPDAAALPPGWADIAMPTISQAAE